MARENLKKLHAEYFKDFYGDTAVFGSVEATECGLTYYPQDRVLFASDAPFDPEKGPMYICETIKIIDNLDIDDSWVRISTGETLQISCATSSNVFGNCRLSSTSLYCSRPLGYS